VVEEEVEVESEEEEVFEVDIKGKMYYTSNIENGAIYEIDAEGNPCDEVGSFQNSIPIFSK